MEVSGQLHAPAALPPEKRKIPSLRWESKPRPVRTKISEIYIAAVEGIYCYIYLKKG
jgi:hypothetical protein